MAQASLAGRCCSYRGHGCGCRPCRYHRWSVQASGTPERSLGKLPRTTTPHAHRGSRGLHQWLWQCGTQRLGIGTRRHNHHNSDTSSKDYRQTLDDNPSQCCGYYGLLLAHLFCLPLSARHTAWRTSWHTFCRGRIMDISPTARRADQREKLGICATDSCGASFFLIVDKVSKK